jgi:hypothetical protein
MKRFLTVFAILLLLVSPAIASVGVQEDGTAEGQATDINIGTGLNHSSNGSVSTITLDQAGDLTFQSSLLAIGRKGGVSTASSSSTDFGTASMPYTVILKYVSGGGGLDTSPGTTLANGQPGQVLVLYIQGLMASGTWVVTASKKMGWTTLTMDTIGDNAALLYVNDTIGWLILSQSGCTVAKTGY